MIELRRQSIDPIAEAELHGLILDYQRGDTEVADRVLRSVLRFVEQQVRLYTKMEQDIEPSCMFALSECLKCMMRWSPDGGASFLTYFRRAIGYDIQVKRRSKSATVMYKATQVDLDDNWFSTLLDESSEFDWDDKEYLHRCLAKLPDKTRKILMLYYFDGQTQKQIGIELGLTTQRIQQILSEGIKSLKIMIK